ncbi:MAG: ATP-dependent Clp protease ATP-binding subunit, partial [Blastocatellia bacterium]|nr:ATP-dependent Clp protease ATP-binding subunit [Blastocatellia bacterium]
MFERYTERSRRVIFFSRYEALQYGSPMIAPEHILLGLMREDKTIPARFFPNRNSLNVDLMRREVEDRIVVRDRIPQSAELHLSPETKRILFWANEESRHLKTRHIGPEHLLAGLLREERSVAAEILFAYGLRLQEVREEIVRIGGST